MTTFTGRKKFTKGNAIKLLLNQRQEQLSVKIIYIYIYICEGGWGMTLN
jgi:hypothetical protein